MSGVERNAEQWFKRHTAKTLQKGGRGNRR